MATITEISQHRATGCDEKRVTCIVTPNTTGNAFKLGAVEPYLLAAAQTIILDTDNGGNETITFDAGAGTVATNNLNAGIANQIGLTLTINCYPYAAQLVTFAGATTTAALAAAEINNQVRGCRAVVTAGPEVTLTCDAQGTDADITITAGTSGITWAAAVGGTGDVANIRAVTATEVVTRVLADTAVTECYLTSDKRFMVRSPTVGVVASELDFTGGTALAALGLAVETIHGTALAAGNGYVTGGEPLDLTSYFTSVCYGGRIISGNGTAAGTVKWDVVCDPAAAITAGNVVLVAHKSIDPADIGGANVNFVEETARIPHSATPLVIEFYGV